MAIYNPKSMHADEFINDEEIQETLRYAEENKNNVELIDSLLEKARPRHTATGTVCARADAPGGLRAAGLPRSPKRWSRCISSPRRSSSPSTATAS